MFKEKRKNRRYPLTGVAQVRAVNSSGDSQASCLIQNISEAGTGLYLYSALEKGSRVHMTVIMTNLEEKEYRISWKGQLFP